MYKPIFSFLVIILSILFAWFSVLPLYKQNKEHSADIVVLSDILNTSSGEIRTLINETKGNLSNINPDVSGRFGVFLPEKIDAIRFANNLQSIGRKNRVILSDIKVDGPDTTEESISSGKQSQSKAANLLAKISLEKEILPKTTESGVLVAEKKYAATKATFSFDSTHETFQLFLNDLERSLGLINVTSLSFVPVSESETAKKTKTPPAQRYQYKMEVETYSLK